MSDDIRLSDIVLLNRLSQSYSVSLALWEHTVLPVTRHKWTHLAVTPARQDGTRSTYPGGMEGWVDLGEWLYTEMTTGGMWLPSTDHIRVPPVLQSTLGSSLSPVWSVRGHILHFVPHQMNPSQVFLECASPRFLWTTSSTCSSGWCPSHCGLGMAMIVKT